MYIFIYLFIYNIHIYEYIYKDLQQTLLPEERRKESLKMITIGRYLV